MDNKIIIGTRGSALALAQANMTADLIRQAYPEMETELRIIKTEGDLILDRSLQSFGGKGVFVAAIEEALEKGQIDIAVHSGKDLPMDLLPDMVIGGVLKREDPRDALVIKRELAEGIWERKGLRIGCSSVRRSSQLKKHLKEHEIAPIRGNVPTRLRKVSEGHVDGTILAMAGLKRLGLVKNQDLVDPELALLPFDTEGFVPAGCQGIIAIEIEKSSRFVPVIQTISDKKTEALFEVERKTLKELNAGCSEPVGVFAEYIGDRIQLTILRESEDEGSFRKQFFIDEEA